MVRYRLHCTQGHEFDSWFQSASAFDTLAAQHLLSCAVCGGGEISKALMAPAVSSVNDTVPADAAPPGPASAGPTPGALSEPMSEIERVLAQMRRHVEENSEYVGMNFAAEARAMHDGTAPQRSVYGEAKPEEARKLIEEGVPVAPLPFMPARKVN